MHSRACQNIAENKLKLVLNNISKARTVVAKENEESIDVIKVSLMKTAQELVDKISKELSETMLSSSDACVGADGRDAYYRRLSLMVIDSDLIIGGDSGIFR